MDLEAYRIKPFFIENVGWAQLRGTVAVPEIPLIVQCAGAGAGIGELYGVRDQAKDFFICREAGSQGRNDLYDVGFSKRGMAAEAVGNRQADGCRQLYTISMRLPAAVALLGRA